MHRAEREERRDSFLTEADDYFAARPGYPHDLLRLAVELGGLDAGARLLELGCGTGQATAWFAKQGFHVLALDRSQEMIRLAERRLDSMPGVQLVCSDFESRPAGRFDGLLAATSYHWLDPETRVARCAEALHPGAPIILLWHTHPHPFTGYFERSQSIYRDVIPGWEPPSTPGMAETGIVRIIDELGAEGSFTAFERRSHDWTRRYDRDLYLRLLNTYSDHRLLPENQRRELLARVAALIDEEFDGVVLRPYRTELIVARKVAG